MEFDAALAGLLVARGKQVPRALELFLKINDDVHTLAATMTNNEDLRTILDLVQRADYEMTETMKRRRIST